MTPFPSPNRNHQATQRADAPRVPLLRAQFGDKYENHQSAQC